jgi:hypothetical protein
MRNLLWTAMAVVVMLVVVSNVPAPAAAPAPPAVNDGEMSATVGPVGNAPGAGGQVAYQVRWGDLPAGGPHSLEVYLVKVQAGGNVVVEGPQVFGNIVDPGSGNSAVSGNLFGPGQQYPQGTQVDVWAKIPGTKMSTTSGVFTIP